MAPSLSGDSGDRDSACEGSEATIAMRSSVMERAVLRSLRLQFQLCPGATKTRLAQEHGLFVDFCLIIDGHPVVCEYDGPAHYCVSPGFDRPLGKTVLKRRVIRHLGYCLVSIPYWVPTPIASARGYGGDGEIADPQGLHRFVELESRRQLEAFRKQRPLDRWCHEESGEPAG